MAEAPELTTEERIALQGNADDLIKDLDYLRNLNPKIIVRNDIKSLQALCDKYAVKYKMGVISKRLVVTKENFYEGKGLLMRTVKEELQDFTNTVIYGIERVRHPGRVYASKSKRVKEKVYEA